MAQRGELNEDATVWAIQAVAPTGIYNSPMPTRVLNLLLAIVLLWSGLSTIEAPHALAQVAHVQTSSIADVGGVASELDGSVEDHHLDDLPMQGYTDPSYETPDLLPTRLAPRDLSPAMGQVRAMTSAEIRPLSLAGPLRPPCSAARTG
jgi:hypothetical protein